MFVSQHSPSAPRRFISAVWSVVLGLMLVVQLLLPNLTNAEQGTWIEICSDEGAVWVEIQTETPTGDEDCPDCATCAFCNLVAAEAMPMPQTATLSPSKSTEVKSETRQCYALNPAQFWPENRGPPADPKNTTVPAAGASMASPQSNGAAPWS